MGAVRGRNSARLSVAESASIDAAVARQMRRLAPNALPSQPGYGLIVRGIREKVLYRHNLG